MTSLVPLDRFGEQETAPVSEAADDAALGEDELTGGAGDSVEIVISKEYCCERSRLSYSLTSESLPTRTCQGLARGPGIIVM